MSETKLTLSEGQAVWWVGSDPRDEKWAKTAVVTKIARKWATLDNGLRVDVSTGWADARGFNSPGRIWPSEAAWREFKRKGQLWHEINRVTTYSTVPEHLSASELESVLSTLSSEGK